MTLVNLDKSRLLALAICPVWSETKKLKDNANPVGIAFWGDQISGWTRNYSHSIAYRAFKCATLNQSEFSILPELKNQLSALEQNGLDELIELINEANNTLKETEPKKLVLSSTQSQYDGKEISLYNFLDLITKADNILDEKEETESKYTELYKDYRNPLPPCIEYSDPSFLFSKLKASNKFNIKQCNAEQKELLLSEGLLSATIKEFNLLDKDFQISLFDQMRTVKYAKENAKSIIDRIQISAIKEQIKTQISTLLSKKVPTSDTEGLINAFNGFRLEKIKPSQLKRFGDTVCKHIRTIVDTKPEEVPKLAIALLASPFDYGRSNYNLPADDCLDKLIEEFNLEGDEKDGNKVYSLQSLYFQITRICWMQPPT